MKYNIMNIQTDSDTSLYLQVAENITIDETDTKERGLVVAITLSHQTGSEEDGEQTTCLTSLQVTELIEQLSKMKQEVESLNNK